MVLTCKTSKFILRPHPGSQYGYGLPIGVVLRDVLKVTSTLAEAQKLLNNNTVLIDGRRKRPSSNVRFIRYYAIRRKSYRTELDVKGRLIVNEIEPSNIKTSKVVGKTAVKGGKIQFRLFDGKTVLSDVKAKIGDSVLYNVETRKIESVLPCQEGASMFLLRGKHAGDTGKLTKIEGTTVYYESVSGSDIETSLKHVYVTGASQ